MENKVDNKEQQSSEKQFYKEHSGTGVVSSLIFSILVLVVMAFLANVLN